MNNPNYLDQYVDIGYLLWLEENYPYYYECAVNKEYSVIPGKMHTEYLEEINKKNGINLYLEHLSNYGAI